MKRLSDFKNEEALDLLAGILEPASTIMMDADAVNELMHGNKLHGAAALITRHKKEVIEILARMDGQDPATYEFGFFELPTRILEVVNDEELLAFFTWQQTQSSEKRTGSVRANTEADGE